MPKTNKSRVTHRDNPISQAVESLFPEHKYLGTTKNPDGIVYVEFSGFLDSIHQTEIQIEANDTSKENLSISEISYARGNTQIYFNYTAEPNFTLKQFKEELAQLPASPSKRDLKSITQEIPKLAVGDRAEAGQLLNEFKRNISKSPNQSPVNSLPPVEEGKLSSDNWFDPTVPAIKPSVGRRHPITLIIEEVEDILARFGFSVATGPEVEWDEINFQKLRLGPDHPSRDTQETYYFDAKRLLRVHTSSVQIRYMESHEPPIRIISPGRVYRRDAIDATHLPSFHQIEGLMVDEKTTLSDLLGILEHTVRQLFGHERQVRFYGHNFPYTEPSLEVEVQNEHGQWLEILGCGMVHPEVLENCGLDSQKYQGWAFGMGADRLAMLKYGIADIRNLYGGDIRFLNS